MTWVVANDLAVALLWGSAAASGHGARAVATAIASPVPDAFCLSQHDGRLLCPARAGCRVDGRGGLLRRRGHCRAVATAGQCAMATVGNIQNLSHCVSSAGALANARATTKILTNN